MQVKTQNIINKNMVQMVSVLFGCRKRVTIVKKIPDELWLNIISRFYRSNLFYLIGGKRLLTKLLLKKEF